MTVWPLAAIASGLVGYIIFTGGSGCLYLKGEMAFGQKISIRK
jgi:hypothetical protein